jgi:monovalent cation:H+ antiporter-2, CPA2 family
MAAETTFYRDLALVFGAAVVGGAIARVLRQPLILGYVLGGVLIGPFTPGPVLSDLHHFELLAEVGVILLMYSIGLEFSFRDLLKVRWVALIGAPLGILLSIALGSGVGLALHWSWQQGVVVGAIISVASTMVLSRFLIERGLLQTEQGQVMIGITLVEDLAVVVLTTLLPSLGDIIDICINNAIRGAQERNTYAQTEGECRPARGSAQTCPGVARFWLLA